VVFVWAGVSFALDETVLSSKKVSAFDGEVLKTVSFVIRPGWYMLSLNIIRPLLSTMTRRATAACGLSAVACGFALYTYSRIYTRGREGRLGRNLQGYVQRPFRYFQTWIPRTWTSDRGIRWNWRRGVWEVTSYEFASRLLK
jgi:hypothetical protein